MTSWIRLWLDMPTDPKWRVIARKSGQALPCVIALYTYMLTIAGGADRPGSISGMSIEDAAAALDMDEDAVSSILDAMETRVTEAGQLSGWEKRQPKREDDGASERKRLQRQRDKEKKDGRDNREGHGVSRTVTQRHAPEAEAEAEAAKAASARDPTVDVSSLTIRLCNSAGIAVPDPGNNFARHSEFLGIVDGWLASGADPPTIEQCVAARAGSNGSAIRSLRYFDGAVRDAIAAKTAATTEADRLVESTLREYGK